MAILPGQVLKPLVRVGRRADDCWKWLGATRAGSHPAKTWHGTTISAQRWLWMQLFGPLTDDVLISMGCGDPSCMNPFHFRAMTVEEVRQESCSGLTPGDVIDIRRQKKHRTDGLAAALADKYGCSKSTIFRIWRPTTVRERAKERRGEKYRGSTVLRHRDNGAAAVQ